MTSIVPVAGKLAKLLCLLASDKPGEVWSAVQALQRVLRERDCDIHDLAGVVAQAELVEGQRRNGVGLTAEEVQQIYQAAYAQGRHEAQAEQTSKPPSWREIIEACWNNINHLDEKDRGFIRSIRARILFDEDQPTEKQQTWIKDCYRKVHLNGNVHRV